MRPKKKSVRVWAVIGNTNTHKTSTIRALTGVRGVEESWHVQYNPGGNVTTYVHPPGLQEIRVSPKRFVEKVNKAGARRVIVALRHKASRGHPNAVDYLVFFRREGWDIAGHAVLGAGALLRGFGKGIPIAKAKDTPSNGIAARLRLGWGIQ